MLARRLHQKNIKENIEENKINTEHVLKNNITETYYKKLGTDKPVTDKPVTDELKVRHNMGHNIEKVRNMPTYSMEGVRSRPTYSMEGARSRPTYSMEGVMSRPTFPDDIKISDIFDPIINVNNNNINIDKIRSNDMYVGFNKNKFIFKSEHDKYIGSFNVDHLIKYFGSVYDSNNQFMTNVNNIDYQNGMHIIEKFIGKVNYNKQLQIADILIFSPTESPFMGNIKMLIIITDLLYEFEQNKLQNELLNVNTKIKSKIERIVKQFIYTLHNYTVKIISVASNYIKDSNITIKLNLINCSTKLMHRITNFVQDQIKIVMNKNKDIEEMQMISLKLNKVVISKYDNILNEINKQKKYILAKPKYYLSGGGDNKDSENSKIITISSSESSETSEETNINDILSDNDINEIY